MHVFIDYGVYYNLRGDTLDSILRVSFSRPLPFATTLEVSKRSHPTLQPHSEISSPPNSTYSEFLHLQYHHLYTHCHLPQFPAYLSPWLPLKPNGRFYVRKIYPKRQNFVVSAVNNELRPILKSRCEHRPTCTFSVWTLTETLLIVPQATYSELKSTSVGFTLTRST